MLRVFCDGCGEELPAGHCHHVVKIEVFTASDTSTMTDADLDQDHMEAVGDMLREGEEAGEEAALEPLTRQFRYDLCDACRQRFVRDPLGRETAPKFLFSKN